MKRMFFSLMAMVCVLTLSAQSIYDFKVNPDEQPDAKPRDASKVKYIK